MNTTGRLRRGVLELRTASAMPSATWRTRSGDLDPRVLLHLLRAGLSADALDVLLNKRSGRSRRRGRRRCRLR